MQLEYQTQDNLETTRVHFMEHEERSRKALQKVLPISDVPYDVELFPEEIVLRGHYPVKLIHQLIKTGTVPVKSTLTQSQGAQIIPGPGPILPVKNASKYF